MVSRVQIVVLFLSVCALFFGCKPARVSTRATDTVEMTLAEQEKAELLAELDRKFENPNAHYRLGRLYQADGLWSQAEHRYNTALSFDPVHRQAQAGKVQVVLAGGDTDRAKLLADIYMNQASNSAGASLNLAMAFQGQAFDDYAMKCYQRSLKLAPNSAKVNKQLGYYYLSKNDTQKAKEYLSRSFQIDPMQAEVAGELGRLGVVVKVPRKADVDVRKLESADRPK